VGGGKVSCVTPERVSKQTAYCTVRKRTWMPARVGIRCVQVGGSAWGGVVRETVGRKGKRSGVGMLKKGRPGNGECKEDTKEGRCKEGNGTLTISLKRKKKSTNHDRTELEGQLEQKQAKEPGQNSRPGTDGGITLMAAQKIKRSGPYKQGKGVTYLQGRAVQRAHASVKSENCKTRQKERGDRPSRKEGKPPTRPDGAG